jgi:hypothetical protein
MVEGPLVTQMLKNMAADVAQLAKSKGCSTVINDPHEANPMDSTVDNYSMPETAKLAGISQTFKRTLVVGRRGAEFNLLETIIQNQGHNVRMFA